MWPAHCTTWWGRTPPILSVYRDGDHSHKIHCILIHSKNTITCNGNKIALHTTPIEPWKYARSTEFDCSNTMTSIAWISRCKYVKSRPHRTLDSLQSRLTEFRRTFVNAYIYGSTSSWPWLHDIYYTINTLVFSAILKLLCVSWYKCDSRSSVLLYKSMVSDSLVCGCVYVRSLNA